MCDTGLQIATALAPFVDLLICETMASAAEAACAAAVASASGEGALRYVWFRRLLCRGRTKCPQRRQGGGEAG